MKGHIQCGCETLPNLYVERSTLLCFDPADPEDFIDTTNYRCTDAALDAVARGDGSKEECLKWQAQAVFDCGCYIHQTGCDFL